MVPAHEVALHTVRQVRAEGITIDPIHIAWLITMEKVRAQQVIIIRVLTAVAG